MCNNGNTYNKLSIKSYNYKQNRTRANENNKINLTN